MRSSIASILGLSFSISLLCAGCSGSHSDNPKAEEKPVFKGQVTHVEYHLSKGVTVIKDAEGKETEFEGFPGIPCADVEIFKNGHEYEIYLAPRTQG